MSNDKILTAEEAMLALLDGKKLHEDCWGDEWYIELVEGDIVYSYESVLSTDMRNLQIYKEPKKKVKRYLFAYENIGGICSSILFYKSLDDARKAYSTVKWIKRLDWSMQEFDE